MSMLVDFDKFGMAERPVLTLAYPQGNELGQLGAYSDFNYDPVLQSYSSISFKYPYYAQNGMPANLYEEINNQLLIKAGSLGEFIIANCEEENNGVERYKQVTAHSAEYQLCKRKINLLNGTYKFGELINSLLQDLPSWKRGEFSTDLELKSRTFDVPDSTLYDFLINDVAKTYECIFVFDTINRTINAYTVNDGRLIKESDIYISYGNFLKSEKIEEVSEELVTVMSCYGGDGVNIASVNPTGTVRLYNFDYFFPMMSESLQAALTMWKGEYNTRVVPCEYDDKEIYIEGTGGEYSNLLRRLKDRNRELIKLKGELKELEGEKSSYEDLQAVKIAGGETKDESYEALVNSLNHSETGVIVRIKAKQTEIKNVEVEISNIKSDIAAINKKLAFTTDGGIFTEADLKELDYFKYESTHQDDNYIITDAMDTVQEQDMMQQLYDSCVELMKDVSAPTYNITADSVNFLFIEKLAPFINTIYDPKKPETLKQLLGVKFHLEIAEDKWIDPILLKFHVNFDNPTDFSMEFSNRYRLNSAVWTYGDLVGESVSATGSMSFDYSAIKAWNTHRNELLDFANNSLDMTRNSLINNAENQTFLIDGTGLRGHSEEKDENGNLVATRRGIWLTADTLAFTDDNWQTVKTAVGLIRGFGNEGNDYRYGINAEVLIGKAILGSELTISAIVENNNSAYMTMDGNGLTVKNDYSLIAINPAKGISITNKNGDDVFYTDTDGNLTLEKITANSGKIAGFTISETDKGVKMLKAGELELRSDGTATIGMMNVGTDSTTFSGNIYAKNIVYGGDAGTLSGSAITSGSIVGTLIGGSYVSPLGNNAVSTDNITSSAITSGKISSNAVTYAKLGEDVTGHFTALYAKTAEIESAQITTADVTSLIANKLTANNLTIGANAASAQLICQAPARFNRTILYQGKTLYTKKLSEITSYDYVVYTTQHVVAPDTSLTEL